MNEWVMDGALVAAGTAFWLGVLTSVSPCPLASNIAAISYIGDGVSHPSRVLTAGFFYTIGRVLTYSFLGWLLVASFATVVGLSNGLLGIMNQLLGPVLILTGMFMTGLLTLKVGASDRVSRLAERVGRRGPGGAALLGALFALSFCPVSAALFFGSLIPLAVTNESPIMMPSLYGVGTGVPVLAFAGVLGLGARALSPLFQRITSLEIWARRATGAVFILVGVYYTLNYVFEAFS